MSKKSVDTKILNIHFFSINKKLSGKSESLPDASKYQALKRIIRLLSEEFFRYFYNN